MKGGGRHVQLNREGDGGIWRWIWLASVLVIYTLTVLIRDHPLDQPTVWEDFIWFRGGRFGYDLRLTATLAYKHFSLYLFGDHLVGYKLPNFFFHLLNGLLIYIFCRRLFAAEAVLFFSALAYLIVAALVLGALISTQLYLERRRPIYWVMVLLFQGVALFTHSFALGLPLLILLFELVLDRERGSRRVVAWAALRYGLLASLSAGQVLLYWGSTLAPQLKDSLPNLAVGGLLASIPSYYLGHLELLFPVLNQLSGASWPAQLLFSLAAATAMALVAWRRLRGKGRVGTAEVFFLCVLAWCAMTFAQLASAAEWEGGRMGLVSHRLYLNQVGLVILPAFLAVRPVAWLSRRSWLPGEGWANLAAVLLCAVLFAMCNGGDLEVLIRHIKGLPATLAARWCSALPACNGPGSAMAGAGAKRISCTDLRGAVMDKRDLSGQVISGLYLAGASLRRANLRNVDARGASMFLAHGEFSDLRGARLGRASLGGAVLHHGDLSGAEGTRANFMYSDLGQSNLSNGNFRLATFRRANLAKSNMRGADLRGSDMSLTYLVGADLAGARLDGAILDEARLMGAVLKGASLRKAALRRAKLIRADLRGADLTGADLTDADLQGVDLRGAKLSGVKLTGARGVPPGIR